jgi:hypothetical protein
MSTDEPAGEAHQMRRQDRAPMAAKSSSMAEIEPRQRFGEILRLIEGLRPRPAAVCAYVTIQDQ